MRTARVTEGHGPNFTTEEIEMLADLEIELVENSLAQRHRSWVAVYPRNTGDADQIAFATLKALVHHPDLFAEALYRRECDDLLDVAEAVARVRTIAREMDNDEALPELTRMRDSSQPEWLRTLAGRELSRRGAIPKVARIDIAEDDRAVCDASSVDEDHFQGCVAVNFPSSGCLACAFTSGCRDARGMMCTPSERKDSRRIVWVTP